MIVDYVSEESKNRDRIGVSHHEASAPLSRRLTFCVEGNIGVGKSTFLDRIIKENEDLNQVTDLVPEPVEKWQDCTHESIGGVLRDPSWDRMMNDDNLNDTKSHNVLNAFYQDPARHAYTFQTYVFITRVLQSYNTAIGKRPFRLMERSVFSDQMIFVRAVHESNWMTNLELNLFRSWFDPVVSQLPGMPSLSLLTFFCHATSSLKDCATHSSSLFIRYGSGRIFVSSCETRNVHETYANKKSFGGSGCGFGISSKFASES